MYHLLLLITDGTIHDKSEAQNIIVALSDMPCSILIFGVGDKNDLSATKELARVVDNEKGGKGPADEAG